MPKVRKTQGDEKWVFDCPGCECSHFFYTGKDQWSFNGDVENPTVHPSIKVQWYDDNKKKNMTCHSSITNGSIHYYADTTHDLKDKTVILPEL